MDRKGNYEMFQVTSEATSEQRSVQTIQRLEKAAKDTSVAATQTIAAANAARPHVKVSFTCLKIH